MDKVNFKKPSSHNKKLEKSNVILLESPFYSRIH